MINCKIVNTSVANIYESCSFSSQLVTQALIWEKLIICDNKNNWYKVKQQDGYIGWIHEFYTIDSAIYDNNESLHNEENWCWVKDRFAILSLENNSDVYISFGSLIPYFNEAGNFFTLTPNNQKVEMNNDSLIKHTKINCFKEVILYGMQLLGTPYLWGGKSSFGYD